MLDRYDQDLLLDYLEGELDAERRAQVDAMLSEDPQLAALLAEIGKDRAALRSLPQAEAPADLVQDLTQSLERRMLLDDVAPDLGPIALPRGRNLPTEPTRGVHWGRVAGLTGLAASVALAAGIVVVTQQNDPLGRTADQFVDESSQLESSSDALAFNAPTRDTAPPSSSARSELAETREPAERVAERPALRGEDAPADALDRPIALLPDDRAIVVDPTPPIRPSTTTPPVVPDHSLGNDGAWSHDRAGRAVALAAQPPSQRLVLFSEEPAISREQLVLFCIDNGIPIVQTSPSNAAPHDSNPSSAEDDAAAAHQRADALDSDGEFALLIDDKQLDALVASMNHNVSLEPPNAGRSTALFSNQAAVLADLSTEPSSAYDSAAQRIALAEQSDEAFDHPAEAAEAPAPAAQQTIQLNLPGDLGSTYANTRNEYNLNLKQQRSAYRPAEQAYGEDSADRSPDTDAAPPAAIFADAEASPPLDKHSEQLAQLEAEPPPAALEQASADADTVDTPAASSPRDRELSLALGEAAAPKPNVPQPDAPPPATSNTTDEQADPERDAQAKPDATLLPSAPLDPTRGNWLTQHLPLAETAPLLLDWRDEREADRPRLVPIAIKRAPADTVNTLRRQQQTQYTERSSDTAPPAESDASDESAEPPDARSPAE